ncbi:CDG_1a_G0033730.mRNA.1.CDS.1 [Saccharomyces cerevisiae]|nr:CDG_1a_G0033730.mRNA.1.CDS.1 [Saccharomyces cerevisiae]CAI7391673.1 CDG_1a_G0033730.mRNA.1.CDS.1 [Saccharomyces cerevisiae]
MAIKKRNKIRLPSGSPEEVGIDGSAHKSMQQIKPLVSNDSEDDDNDICVLQPIKFKKVPKRDITFDGEQAIKEDNSHYEDLYHSKKNTNASTGNKDDLLILNMEDLMEGNHHLLSDSSEAGSSSEGEHISSIPTRGEIAKLKAQKSLSRRKISESDVTTERDYVKLLDSEDKREIMETIRLNGGLKRNNEKEITNFSDDEMQGFQDEMLALTDNQIAIQKDSKRKIIEKAINEVPYRANEEWETQLLSKGNINKSNEKIITPLPVLFPDDDESGNSIERINEMVSKISLQRKKVEMRLQALEKTKIDLEKSKASLINKLVGN